MTRKTPTRQLDGLADPNIRHFWMSIVILLVVVGSVVPLLATGVITVKDLVVILESIAGGAAGATGVRAWLKKATGEGEGEGEGDDGGAA